MSKGTQAQDRVCSRTNVRELARNGTPRAARVRCASSVAGFLTTVGNQWQGAPVSKDGGSMRARRFCAHAGSCRTTKYLRVHPGPANIAANRFRVLLVNFHVMMRTERPIATARDDQDHSARSRVSVALSLRCRRYARQRWPPNASSVGPGKWLEAPRAELPAAHGA